LRPKLILAGPLGGEGGVFFFAMFFELAFSYQPSAVSGSTG